MPYVDVQQLSVEWLKMRIGCASASHTADIMAKPKRVKKAREGEPAIPPQEMAARIKYRKAKVIEELTGRSMETYVSPYMERGLEVEPLAIAAYEMEHGVEVLPGGIFFHDRIPRWCASPDGRIEPEGLIECKFLSGLSTEANHFDLLDGAEVPEEYVLQMQSQLSCAPERKYVDFVSYYPEARKSARKFEQRFERDSAKIEEIEAEVILFLSEFAAKVAKYDQIAAD